MPELIVQPAETPWIAEVQLTNERLVKFRHVRTDDHELIAESIRTASPETLLHRFFSPIRNVSPAFLQRMLIIDSQKEVCIVGVLATVEQRRIICGARYVCQQANSEIAEIAITIHDEFQRLGLGSFLLRLLIQLAQQNGIRQFEAYVMASNQGMLNLMRKISPDCSSEHQGEGIYRYLLPIAGEHTPLSLPSPPTRLR